MVEMICGGNQPDPDIIREVEEYVDRSTGILTIKQMKWLEEAVKRHGLTRHVRHAKEYKRLYNERLPMEIQNARERGAIALGRIGRGEPEGTHPRKRERLLGAGADLIIPDFSHHGELVELLTGLEHRPRELICI